MKESCINFMQWNGVLVASIQCPGALVHGCRQGGCNNQMVLKKTHDSKDGLVWHCRKLYKVQKDNRIYTVKDIKLSIRHHSWLVDTKVPLELVLELIYLWDHNFSHGEIMHELKLSRKIFTEWTQFFWQACICTVMDNSEPIGGNGIKVEID